MIKDLFAKRFVTDYDLKKADVIVPLTLYKESFYLSDQKACRMCNTVRPYKDDCDEENLRVEVKKDEEVTVINFEAFLNQFANALDKYSLKRCDYILVDDTDSHRKFAFCDLTCSASKYVEGATGKRAKAMLQMKESLKSLLTVDVLNQYVLTFQKKVFLFGWRESPMPKDEPRRNDPLANMSVFNRTPSSESRTLEYEVFYGFSFIQVKYPARYQW